MKENCLQYFSHIKYRSRDEYVKKIRKLTLEIELLIRRNLRYNQEWDHKASQRQSMNLGNVCYYIFPLEKKQEKKSINPQYEAKYLMITPD